MRKRFLYRLGQDTGQAIVEGKRLPTLAKVGNAGHSRGFYCGNLMLSEDDAGCEKVFPLDFLKVPWILASFAEEPSWLFKDVIFPLICCKPQQEDKLLCTRPRRLNLLLGTSSSTRDPRLVLSG